MKQLTRLRVAFACLSFLAPFAASAAPPMWTRVFNMNISFEQCRERVRDALTTEGYANFRDYGSGWTATGGRLSVAAHCTATSNGVAVSIVIASDNGADGASPRERLADLIRRGSPVASRPTPPPPPPRIEIIDATGPITMRQYRGRTGMRIRVNCHPAAIAGKVWGTNLYIDDSSVCAAAVHAGRIGPNGGMVLVEISLGGTSFQGSYRNGINSASYGKWDGSYLFAPTAY
jgi:hypothetical protein